MSKKEREIWKFEMDFKKSRFSRLRSLWIMSFDILFKNPLSPFLLDMTFHYFISHLGLPSPGEVLQNFKRQGWLNGGKINPPPPKKKAWERG